MSKRREGKTAKPQYVVGEDINNTTYGIVDNFGNEVYPSFAYDEIESYQHSYQHSYQQEVK